MPDAARTHGGRQWSRVVMAKRVTITPDGPAFIVSIDGTRTDAEFKVGPEWGERVFIDRRSGRFALSREVVFYGVGGFASRLRQRFEKWIATKQREPKDVDVTMLRAEVLADLQRDEAFSAMRREMRAQWDRAVAEWRAE